MPLTITQVDAFTSKPFAGNPAGVCVLPEERDEAWMQDVAKEMNLAETAFLVPRPDGWGLRWFTPAAEVDLCGHATLASAHVLWETGLVPQTETARFHTKSGLLTAVRRGDWIELDFPATPDERVDAPAGLVESLGASPRYIGRSIFDYLVELGGEDSVRSVRPDFRGLARLGTRGVIVTARSADPAFDFVSRYFAPSYGIDEDPVTGSAHCALAPYWSRQLGKTSFRARQLSARGGELKVELRGDRVGLGGQAVTVLRAELLV
ncbi:MAG TPA: PhzF family phenazine biosynthesis protein [Thermoanaerobaculia bacterium]